MKKRLTIFLLCVFLSLTVANQSVVAKDTWTSVQSKNFLLIGNGSEKDIKQVGERLEQFREVFTHLFPRMQFTSPVPTTVIVFKSESSYRPFKGGANLVGYFQPGPDVNYITLTTDLQGTQDPFDVIFHEYTHLLVDNTIGNAPLWFNEGLAEYYSTFLIKDDQKFTIGNPIGNHVLLLRQNKLLPLRTLFEVDHKSPHYNERNKQSIFYAQSWAFMHYMIIGKPGRVEQLGKFLDLLNTSTPKEQAFQQAFETTFETVEKELREYVQKDRYNILNGHFKNKLETDAGMTSRVISEAEAQAYLGDLLLHSNRKDSMKYLQKSVELDPDLALANAAMGMAMLREDKLDNALKYLERAVKASNQNYLVHYYYAYALSQQKSSSTPDLAPSLSAELGEKIRSELLQAIKLRPDYPTSYSLLGYISLITGNNLEESRKLLTQALRSSPGRTELAFMLGQVYMRSGDYKQARALLEQVVKSKAEDETRRHAEMMLNQLVGFMEQQARYEELRKSQATQSSELSSVSSGNLSRTQTTTSETVPATAPRDQFSYLRDILVKPAEGQKQIQGSLLGVKCEGKGLVFVVKTEAETLRLFTQSFDEMSITTYTPSVSGDITCGDRKGDESVVVVFGPSTNARLKVNGTIKSIEFVPEKFRLSSN